MPCTPEPDIRRDQLCAVIDTIVRSLVDDRGAVSVVPVQMENRTRLQIKCAAGDVGKLIGKQGRTERALRTLLTALAQGHGGYHLDILKPETAKG